MTDQTKCRDLASALQSLRARWMGIAEEQSFGDQLDGDFDTILEAVNALKKNTRAQASAMEGGNHG